MARGNAKQHSLGIIFEELDAELKYKDKMAKKNRNNGEMDPEREKEIYFEQTYKFKSTVAKF